MKIVSPLSPREGLIHSPMMTEMCDSLPRFKKRLPVGYIPVVVLDYQSTVSCTITRGLQIMPKVQIYNTMYECIRRFSTTAKFLAPSWWRATVKCFLEKSSKRTVFKKKPRIYGNIQSNPLPDVIYCRRTHLQLNRHNCQRLNILSCICLCRKIVNDSIKEFLLV